jgi:hypothetical protein
MSWDLQGIVAEPGALDNMRKIEEHYRQVFSEDIKR